MTPSMNPMNRTPSVEFRLGGSVVAMSSAIAQVHQAVGRGTATS